MIATFAALEDECRWLAWRDEERGSHRTKVPYAANGHGHGDATDPATWGTCFEAEGRAKELVNGNAMTGVGIALGAVGDEIYLAGVDLDSSIDENRALAPWAVRILSVLGTYAEVSPSGRGVKAFFYVPAHLARAFLDRIGVAPGSWGCSRAVPGFSKADHGPGIELYLSHRFFTVTGRLWSVDHQRIVTLDAGQLTQLAELIPRPSTSRSGSWPGGGGDGLDNSRSGKAWRAAIELAAPDYAAMVEGLRQHADPEIANWADEVDDRQLQRLWDRAAAKEAQKAEQLSDFETRHPPPDIDTSDPNPAAGPTAPDLAAAAARGQGAAGVTLADFWAYMPMHNYIYTPARDPWPAASVNARLPRVPLFNSDGTPVLDDDGEPVELPASAWLDKHKPVEMMTWAPGLPLIIRDRLISEGGWIERRNVSCFNLYRPPLLAPGDPAKAGQWIAHVDLIYPDDAEHIRYWLAQRVQRPQDKINHALVLGGLQGIGKDSLIEPAKRAVGPWNVAELSPVQLTGRFNGFVKSVILRISEAHDLGEVDRYQFYEHLKVYTAAPPDVIRVDEKNLREHNVLNCCGVIITTNHKSDGLYLPADDRRHYVAWSEMTKEDFDPDYWNELWGWYASGGDRHVAAYLATLDLSGFDPKAPPPKTAAFWDIVNASRIPEDAELADILDALGNPNAVTLNQVILKAREEARHDFADWLGERKNRRLLAYRFEACGYPPVRNPDRDTGLWVIRGRRQVVYGKATLTFHQRVAAARAL